MRWALRRRLNGSILRIVGSAYEGSLVWGVPWDQVLFVFLCDSPQWARSSSFTSFLDHTQRRAPHSLGLLWTVDQLVAETSTWLHTTPTTDRLPYPRVGFEPTISAVELPQTYALDRAATEICEGNAELSKLTRIHLLLPDGFKKPGYKIWNTKPEFACAKSVRRYIDTVQDRQKADYWTLSNLRILRGIVRFLPLWRTESLL